MNKLLLSLAVACLLMANSSQTIAQTSPYFAQGEDIDNIINGDEASPLVQIEEIIFSYAFIRKLQKYFFNVQYIDIQTEDENGEYVSESDGC